MEKIGNGQTAPVLRKGKKKQSKDEVDRQKQAEKKKRRIEKALATSAAIRLELEKKKQKKLDELKRLEEEGAAVAESVALHVLLGEDTDDSCPIMVNGRKLYNVLEQSNNVSLFMGCPNMTKYASIDAMGCATDTYGSSYWQKDDWVLECSVPQSMNVGAFDLPYYERRNQVADISPGLIAQAVSALHIADDSHEIPITGQERAAVMINHIVGGTNSVSMNLSEEF